MPPPLVTDWPMDYLAPVHVHVRQISRSGHHMILVHVVFGIAGVPTWTIHMWLMDTHHDVLNRWGYYSYIACTASTAIHVKRQSTYIGRSGRIACERVHSTLECNYTVYPKKYAHGFCFAVLCCGYTVTDFPISIRLTSLALWQSNDCPSASKSTLMNMDKYFMWIHYERLHNHNKAKHNKTVCIFLGYTVRQVDIVE